MSGLLLKIVLLVAMTHGLRVIGRWLGPARSGLMLGIPCSTAIALVDCAERRGSEAATAMAEACLLGLAAAVAVPLIYARALGRGWTLPWLLMSAVSAYLVAAMGLSLLHGHGAVVNVAIAAGVVLLACRLAERTQIVVGSRPTAVPSWKRCLLLRAVVPAGYLLAVTALRELAGARWAGLLSTFPGMSLALLVVTHLEGGNAEAGRMARALPPGNLGTIAFVVAFRYVAPELGLISAIALGYAFTLLVLPVVGVLVERACGDRAPLRATAGRAGGVRYHRFAETARARVSRAVIQNATLRRRRTFSPRRRLAPRLEPVGM